MARLRRTTPVALADDASLRLRAAWLYYDRKMTQKDIAAALGVGRTTVIRLLDEALKRREVQIWIDEGESRCMALAMALEQRLGLDEAIVVPRADAVEAAARSVGLALGKFLSEAMMDDMMIGVGWGRTLLASLGSFRVPRIQGAKVVSLLGGVIEVRQDNPSDFAWQLASQIGADCFLYPAPLIVDSLGTKMTLREKCGLDRIDRLGAALDVAVVSVGEVTHDSTSLSRSLLDDRDYRQVISLGGVCDLMCNLLDAEGVTIDHVINDRVMSVDLSSLAQAAHIVIATGGERRASAILAAMHRIGCNTLITDEGAAEAILATGVQMSPRPGGSEIAGGRLDGP